MQCKNCKWFKPSFYKWRKLVKQNPWWKPNEYEFVSVMSKTGECHKQFPEVETIKKDVDDGVHYRIHKVAYWPTVGVDDFCGEFNK